MKMQRGRYGRRRAAGNRWPLVAVAVLLFAGLFMQITMLSQIATQNKKASALEREIETLSANAENLELNINQFHNLDSIEKRARQLGMEQPDETQIRVVSVVKVDTGESFTQAAENIGGESIQN